MKEVATREEAGAGWWHRIYQRSKGGKVNGGVGVLPPKLAFMAEIGCAESFKRR